MQASAMVAVDFTSAITTDIPEEVQEVLMRGSRPNWSTTSELLRGVVTYEFDDHI